MWLSSSDPDGYLKIKESPWEVREQGIGVYEVPRLDIQLFDRSVMIIPKARYTVTTAHPPQKTAPERAAGRVDITDEIRRHILYRFSGDQGEVWLIDDLKNPPQELTRELFESALMSYLR